MKWINLISEFWPLLLVDFSQSDQTGDLSGATPVGKWLND